MFISAECRLIGASPLGGAHPRNNASPDPPLTYFNGAEHPGQRRDRCCGMVDTTGNSHRVAVALEWHRSHDLRPDMTAPAKTPAPPYYAVIFTSVRSSGDNGYTEAADRILALAETQPGFLGFESARQELGISVSYWASLDAIQAWKEHAAHREVQARAGDWYTAFRVRVCRVEREHGF
jgi:heme-degrading monooxygenase HmoA